MRIKLPRKHAADWAERCPEDDNGVAWVTVVEAKHASIVLDLTEDGLADLISDARHYAENMGPEATGDIDYRPAARRCLAALERVNRAGLPT